MKNFPVGLLFSAWIFICFPAAAQTGYGVFSADIPGKHRGAVTALVRDWQGRILSAGEDGFLQIWNNEAAEARFQLSPYGITAMVLRPGRAQIAVVESDGLGLNRISAWDYQEGKNLFTLHFRDSISYVSYSASGGFLIVARSGRTGAAFIHPETGEILESPELSGAIAFAATGRSERTMITYFSSGILSYWDLENGNEIRRFQVPPDIRSPVLFGNNRFLGGFDSGGLLILDAVTGSILARDEFIRAGSLFIDDPDSSRFYCLDTSGDVPVIFRMEINQSGRLITINRRNLPAAADFSCCASGDGDNVILGSTQGTVWILSTNGGRAIYTGNPLRIIDTDASAEALAFITEDNTLGYIPLDYSLLSQSGVLMLEDAGSYTNIVSDPLSSQAAPESGASHFLLWQEGRSFPMIKKLSGPPVEANSSGFVLDKLDSRFPLRTAAFMGGSILFLDTAGSVSILNPESGEIRFSYSAAGSVDAAFIDENTIILGRSAVSGNTPFLTVNASTGETVPLAYPGLAGVRVYRGGSGAIYGAAVTQTGGAAQTSIIRLNTSSPARSEKLVEFGGEDSSFALAECGGNLASTIGGGAATIYRALGRNQFIAPEMVSLERSQGLPLKIINGGRHFVVLDEEGGITWHNTWTGKILAALRLHPGFWILETDEGIIRGTTQMKQPD